MTSIPRGKLRLFFSYAEHMGKTQAMLAAAQRARRKGLRVLVGYIAPHSDQETAALYEGLEVLPTRMVAGAEEFDLDRALAARPEVVVVDELAHTNPQGSRHGKRYQDIEELLEQGIHVYTTVNVSNLEGLHDTVASLTGEETGEWIPDAVFDGADQVELVDMEPQTLLEKTGVTDRTIQQLTALREVALHRCAERLKCRAEDVDQENSFQTDEHILVCLSSSPSNARIIRTAAKMARAFNSEFTALFVETPDFSALLPEDRQRLQEHQYLARQLGAHIEMVTGDDIACQIADFVRLSGVTKIVLGRSSTVCRQPWDKLTLGGQLLRYLPEIDIHIIPDQTAEQPFRRRTVAGTRERKIVSNSCKSLGILVGATLLCQLLSYLGFTESNIIMIYILGVLLTSIVTSQRVYSLVSSVASVCIFNFFFTVPRFSFAAYETGYPVTFAIMFLTAYVTGTLAIRYKEQAGQSAKIAYRTGILFNTDQLLSKAQNKEEILQAAAEQIGKLLDRDIVIFENNDGKLSPPRFFPRAGQMKMQPFLETEEAAARWTLTHNHAAGATTDTLSDARYLYLALRVSQRVYGVIGIAVGKNPLDPSEHSILLSILGECALALENDKNAREKEAAAVLAESEQLRANLLRTISHDLRTPLTTISGNASNLLSNSASFDEATKHRLYADIYEDSLWLINLVENLLSATRIEEGRMTLHTSTELLDDIVEEAVVHSRRKCEAHQISVECDEELLLVKADARLVVQVIVNIVDNAIKYTPPGSSIVISTCKSGDMAQIRIADNGDGIPDEDKSKIFDKFYCGANQIADNRRSIGLGLYLCRAIVEAHGGQIQVYDNEPKGTVFRFTIPCQEVTLHE